MIDFLMKVRRRWLNEKATIGELYIGENPQRQCYTLEDKVRPEGIKIPGETAIPPGRYEVIVTYSERFKREMPLLLDVPNFEGVRIHSGNTDADTEGCILVGRIPVNNDCIGESRLAFGELFPLIDNARKNGKVYIEITNEPYKKEGE